MQKFRVENFVHVGKSFLNILNFGGYETLFIQLQTVIYKAMNVLESSEQSKI